VIFEMYQGFLRERIDCEYEYEHEHEHEYEKRRDVTVTERRNWL